MCSGLSCSQDIPAAYMQGASCRILESSLCGTISGMEVMSAINSLCLLSHSRWQASPVAKAHKQMRQSVCIHCGSGTDNSMLRSLQDDKPSYLKSGPAEHVGPNLTSGCLLAKLVRCLSVHVRSSSSYLSHRIYIQDNKLSWYTASWQLLPGLGTTSSFDREYLQLPVHVPS